MGASEVRLYRNEITGELEVGKRLDLLGMDKAVVALEAKLLSFEIIRKCPDEAAAGHRKPTTLPSGF